MFKKKIMNKKGFAYIELMIAIGILAIVCAVTFNVIMMSVNNMGVLLYSMGKLDEALAYFEETLQGRR